MNATASSRQQAKDFFVDPKKALADSTSAGAAKKPLDKSRRRHLLREYRRWLWPYRFAILGLFTLALGVAGLDAIWPLAIKGIMNLLEARPDAAAMSKINHYGLFILGILLIKQAIESVRNYRTAQLNAKVVFKLRRRLYDRLLGLPLTDLSEMKSGGITSRLASDVDNVTGLVQMAVISPGVAAMRIVLTLCILLYLSWRMAVGALIVIPPMAILSFFWLRRVKPIYKSMQRDRIDIDGRVNETFGGIRVVRAFRREHREERVYAVGHHTVIRKYLRAQWLEMILETGWGLLIPFASLLLVWYGGYLYLQGKVKIGDIFAFQIYAVLLLQPVWAIVSSVSQTQKAITAMERVFETLEMPLDKPDAVGAVEASRSVEEIRFNNVSFEYRPGTPVISAFSLNVPGGSVVALVGPSGAGKTTLTDLVARFYDPTSGSITLNGVDLRKLQLQSYRSLLAIVQQDTFLFDGTVRQNIAYGRRGAPDELILDAARRANALEFIERLPSGLDTLIGERGFKLSGGQRQRLTIARAILADPQILILDEATSNLDTESEQLIQSSLAELFRGRTTFVIAHRLSTITHADLIVAMEAGQLREVGTHEELMAKRGFYFEMVERQQQQLGRLEIVEA